MLIIVIWLDTDSTQGSNNNTERRGIRVGSNLLIDGAVVIGGGDIIVLRVKQALLIVQQLCQDSADRLLVSKVLSSCWQTADGKWQESLSWLHTASHENKHPSFFNFCVSVFLQVPKIKTSFTLLKKNRYSTVTLFCGFIKCDVVYGFKSFLPLTLQLYNLIICTWLIVSTEDVTMKLLLNIY